MNSEVTIEYEKLDGSPYTQFRAVRLGEDEHGAWLRSEAPLQMRVPAIGDDWLAPDLQGRATRHDAPLTIVGEAELAAAGYPDDVVAAARAAQDDLESCLRRLAEPFGDVFARWKAADPSKGA